MAKFKERESPNFSKVLNNKDTANMGERLAAILFLLAE